MRRPALSLVAVSGRCWATSAATSWQRRRSSQQGDDHRQLLTAPRARRWRSGSEARYQRPRASAPLSQSRCQSEPGPKSNAGRRGLPPERHRASNDPGVGPVASGKGGRRVKRRAPADDQWTGPSRHDVPDEAAAIEATADRSALAGRPGGQRSHEDPAARPRCRGDLQSIAGDTPIRLVQGRAGGATAMQTLRRSLTAQALGIRWLPHLPRTSPLLVPAGPGDPGKPRLTSADASSIVLVVPRRLPSSGTRSGKNLARARRPGLPGGPRARRPARSR